MRKYISKSIPELLGISKEELEKRIEFLLPKHKEFIEKYFDENYEKIQDLNWSEVEIRTYYHIIVRRLRKLADKPKNSGHRINPPFYEKVNITKERVLEIKPLLNEKARKFLEEHFDEFLDFKTSYDSWSEKDKYYYLNGFTEHIKRVSKPRPQSSLSPIYIRCGITKEKLEEIIPSLSLRSQEIISKYFNKDFIPLQNVAWESNDKDYFEKYTLFLIKNYDKRMYKKEHPVSVYDNLLETLNVTKNQFKFLMSKCKRRHYLAFIENYYDDDFKLKEGLYFTDESKYMIGFKVKPYFILLRNKYSMNIINNEFDEQDKISTMETELENTSKFHSEFNINYHKLYLSYIKNNTELNENEKIARIRSMKRLYKEYKQEILSKRAQTLTRKKN